MTAKILLVHHFSLSRVTGVRALVRELLWRIPVADPATAVAYEAYEGHPHAASFVEAVAGRHGDATTVVAINGHVDFQLDFTISFLEWAARTHRRVYLYVHDYWPQHGDLLRRLSSLFGCGLLASTDLIRNAMAADGLDSTLVQVGVPLGNVEGGALRARREASRWVVGSMGRAVPRKRFQDVVAGFGQAALDGRAALQMRLLESCVRDRSEDERIIEGIVAEGRRYGLGPALQIVRWPSERADYRGYDLYVCASSYEGFSMTPIEAAYSGCAPVMSDIPAHRTIAAALFPDEPETFLFPTADTAALARVMVDEIETGRRGSAVRARVGEIRETIESCWSTAASAQALLGVAAPPVEAR
jgi:glycosyltransferase involved in cell wall biosynthesis